MLLYPHSFAGLPLLYQVAGSAVPRAVVPALVSMLITLAIEETLSQDFLTHGSQPSPTLTPRPVAPALAIAVAKGLGLALALAGLPQPR